MKLKEIIIEADKFLKENHKFYPENSNLNIYDTNSWRDFLHKNKLNLKLNGLYSIKDITAHVNLDSELLITNTFHELHGHGSMVEHSNIFLNRQNQNIETHLYTKHKTTTGFLDPHIGNYEGFALWMEKYLTENIYKKSNFEKKEKELPLEYKELLDFFTQKAERIGVTGFLYQLGFPKYYNKEEISDLFKKLYENSLKKVDLAILYGSKKPRSDIDLFVITNTESENFCNGWLDIYSLERNEFNKKMSLLDISVLDPLFTGEIIYGDEKYLNKLKNNVKQQEITQEAIIYNREMYEQQKQMSKNKQTEKIANSYMTTYKLNAENLEKGIKKLTKKSLLN